LGNKKLSKDSFHFKIPFFSFDVSKHDEQIKLKEGETILLRYWNWIKFGYIRKALTLVDGKVQVQRID